MILGILASSVIKAIVDTFNRTTSGSLGTANSGQVWNAIRGVWFANGSAAQSNNTATDYAIAAIPLSPNATINVDTTGGCGASFWVTDSGSWWGAFPYYTSAGAGSCTGPTAYCYSAGCTPSGSCGPISESITTTCTGPTVSCQDTTNTCSPGGCGTVTVTTEFISGYYASNDTNCADFGATSVACSNCGTTGSPGSCSPAPQYYCCSYPSYTRYTRTQNTLVNNYTRSSATTVTTTTYTSAVRIISSVSGTVATDSTTTLATSTSSSQNIGSIQVNTNGTTLTVKGYSDAGQVTQLGSTITRTPTTPVRGESVGTIKAPTVDSQGSTLDNFNATS